MHDTKINSDMSYACVAIISRFLESKSTMYVDDDGSVLPVLCVYGPVDDKFSLECSTPRGVHTKRADIMAERLIFEFHAETS